VTDVAESVRVHAAHAPAPPVATLARARPALLHRCGDGPCDCEQANADDDELGNLQRSATAAAPSRVPAIVHDVLRSSGQPLDGAARAYLEPRLGHDFGHVRLHSGAHAAASARAVNAAAYTVGSDVVLGSEAAGPARLGLLAHELTHVVQQLGASRIAGGPLAIAPSSSPLEHEAEHAAAAVRSGRATVRGRAAPPALSRADPASVARVIGRGGLVGSGVQLFPTNVVDTIVGPVSGQGGLLRDESARLSVIIGPDLTLRGLARQVLPLWTTATPFTDPVTGTVVPLVVITEDELARGLAVFNEFFLPLATMAEWRAGLRLPLPVEIDEATHAATVHPLLIQALAGSFQAADEPKLDQAAPATAAPAPAALVQQATDFLAAHPDALGRGYALVAQALTNAVAARPLVAEVFLQLSPAGLEVALAFMDSIVNRQVDLLQSQRDGSEILGQVAAVLAAAPTPLPADQQASLDRANLMLGRRGAIVPRPAPGRACEPGRVRDVTVQPVFFRLNAADPAPTGATFPGRMAVTREVWTKLGVAFAVNAAIMRTDATNKTRGTNLVQVNAIAALRTGAGVEVFVVDNDIAFLGGGGTFMSAPGPSSKIVLSDRGTSNTLLAHEMGHALGLNHPGTGSAHDGDARTVMQPSGSHSVENSRRNTALNAARMTWPVGAATCIRPDP
jgi:Domain of unknown function (DUF4157)